MVIKKLANLEILDDDSLIEERKTITKNVGIALGYSFKQFKENNETGFADNALGSNNLNDCIL